jgi:N-glycosidase YbiA
MLGALRAKFTQHLNLRARLLATGDARLVEHTTRDTYWADGGDGTGRNRLGDLLMRMRAELAR